MSKGGVIIPISGGAWPGWVHVESLAEAVRFLKALQQHGEMIGHTALRIEGKEGE